MEVILRGIPSDFEGFWGDEVFFFVLIWGVFCAVLGCFCAGFGRCILDVLFWDALVLLWVGFVGFFLTFLIFF
jgi:hypothetical protein